MVVLALHAHAEPWHGTHCVSCSYLLRHLRSAVSTFSMSACSGASNVCGSPVVGLVMVSLCAGGGWRARICLSDFDWSSWPILAGGIKSSSVILVLPPP